MGGGSQSFWHDDGFTAGLSGGGGVTGVLLAVRGQGSGVVVA